MQQFARLMAIISIGAFAVGATIALHSSGTTTRPSTHSAHGAPAARSEAASLEEVLASTRGLSAAIRHARLETSGVIAKSFASLARQRAQLNAEAMQLAGEARTISSRATLLAGEDAALRREAALLGAAHAGRNTSTIAGGEPHDN